jgi:hypothetical protein
VTAPSTDFLNALVASHVLVTQVDALDPTGVYPRGIDLPFTDGTVRVDATARIRRTLDLTIPDPRWLPTDPDDALSPYSGRLRVRQGVAFPDGTVELTPVGVFRVESVEGDELRGPLTVVGHSYESFVIDDRFESPRQASGPSCVALIQTLIRETLPTAEILVTATRDQAVPTATWNDDRWGAIEEMATVIGGEVHCDPTGRFVIADVVDPAAVVTPDYTITVGEQGTLKSVARGFSREGVFNAVVARSSGADTTLAAPIQGVWRDTDPNSPTRYGGPLGKVPRLWSSPLLTTVAQAQLSAQTIGLKSLGLSRSVQVGAVPNPLIEAGKSARIVTSESRPGGEMHVLESFPLRLRVGGGSWVAKTRTTTYDPTGGP